MAGTQPWFAREGTIEFSDAVTLDATSASSTVGDIFSSSTEFTTKIKNVEISGGGRDMSAGNLFGLNNQYQEESRASEVTATFTMVAKDISILEQVWGSSVTVTGDFNRVTGAEISTNKAAILKFTDGTNTAYWVMNNAVMSTDNIVSCAADGTTEMSVQLKALVQDVFFDSDI